MGTRDPRVDAYIAKAQPFARPILAHIRSVVHAAVPAADETIKWGFPHFTHHGILCAMAAFKAHAALVFWRDAAVEGIRPRVDAKAMGQFGRLTSIDDLPSRSALTRALKRAAALNAAGTPARPRSTRAR